jgi:hypothetical protein
VIGTYYVIWSHCVGPQPDPSHARPPAGPPVTIGRPVLSGRAPCRSCRSRMPMRLALVLLPAFALAGMCSDGDMGCLERECSMWCSRWTCKREGCRGCAEEIGCEAKSPPPPSPPPQPMLPPWDASTEPDTLTVLAHNGKIYANGERLDIKGVNWFGSEGRSGPPLGLDKHKIAWYMDFLRQHKFNAIRFLFNHKTILDDETLEPPNEEVYGKGAAWEAPELENYKYLDMFHKLAEVASEHGILVMMAAHRLSPSAWPGDGLWYDATVSEQGVKESWSKIAAKLCGQWNVFAVDLQNEPHASSWGKGGTKDWGHAAERLGNHVLSSCPRWLIMVEGVGYDPGAPGMDNGGAGIWWGENLAGAKAQPVKLSNPHKLVYSPHSAPPLAQQPCAHALSENHKHP